MSSGKRLMWILFLGALLVGWAYLGLAVAFADPALRPPPALVGIMTAASLVAWGVLMSSVLNLQKAFLKERWLSSDLEKFLNLLSLQEVVDDRLRSLAVYFREADIADAEARRNLATNKNPDEEARLQAAVRSASGRLEINKTSFWALHGLAKRFRYRVRDSYKDYLPPNEDAA